MPFLEQDIFVDEITSLRIAQALSPIDTGNLRYNAIKSFATEDGFVITYNLNIAYYIRLLEEGISTMKHFGFIGSKTVPAIASYLQAKYETKDKQRSAMFDSLLQKLDENDLSRVNILSKFNQESREDRMKASLLHNEQEDDFSKDYGKFDYREDFGTMKYEYRGRW